MNKSMIIIGEASETDSEDEKLCEELPSNMTSSIQGAVIPGEDSESENENDASISSAVSALNQLDILEELNKKDCDKYDSLLHQKLRESNTRLLQNIDTFCNNKIEESKKTLDTIDQQLIKSQLTIQNAVTSLKSLSTNSEVLKNKLHSLLTAKFLPNINVNK